jgi:hypothetical protein
MTEPAHQLVSRLTVVLLGTGCLIGLVHVLSVIGLHVPFDPNEGWNAYFARMAMTHGTPYPAVDSFLVNNYPPLSFYVIGEVGKVVGDNIVAGRIVALLALLVTSLGLARAARLMGCTTLQATFAGLLFVAGVLLTSDYAGMNDPQLLGHAIAIWGLVAVLQTPRTSRMMILAALLLTVAFFVKHNLVLLPLSLGAWLLLADRRHATPFVAGGLIFLLLGFGMFREYFHFSLWQQLSSARLYSLANVGTVALNWLGWAAIPICAAGLLFYAARRDQFAILAIIFATASTLGGLCFLGGTGVDASALFDADIALALCAGLLLDRLESTVLSAAAAIACVVPLVFMVGTLEGDWTGSGFWLHPLAQDRATTAREIALLRASREPVLCEMLALCYWAGKTPQVDVFNMDQRIRTGAQSADGLLRQIAAKRFSIIQLEALRPFPLPPVVERAVLHNYRIIRRDDERVFLAPR